MMHRPHAFICTNKSQSLRRFAGSMPEVGSSRKTTGVTPKRLVATQSRRFWPPLSVDTRAPRFSARPKASNALLMVSLVVAAGTPRKAAKKVRCSSTEYSKYKGLSCGQTLKWRRASCSSTATSTPQTLAEPEVIGSMPVMQLMAVVFPAPLWPRRAKISARFTSRLMPSTARCGPKDLTRSVSCKAGAEGFSPPSFARARRGQR
mmetsp:Transcript_14424/g.41297  ORF Transcript_14424/g.41297 Transcript_14424/m.41297 type:complete len:205 (-) Transcript_14424:711-1325(-)